MICALGAGREDRRRSRRTATRSSAICWMRSSWRPRTEGLSVTCIQKVSEKEERPAASRSRPTMRISRRLGIRTAASAERRPGSGRGQMRRSSVDVLVHRRSRADVARRMCWRCPRPPKASFSWAIRGSSSSRSREAIRMASTCLRSTTFSVRTRPIRPAAASSCRKPGGCTPSICAFNRRCSTRADFTPRPGLEKQAIRSTGRLNGAGLRYLPVEHDGNQNSSPEEADEISDLVEEILGSGATWVDREGVEAAVGLEDILIIAPYNAQVFELQERLPGARIGTVDKFQGQEAPIVDLFDDDLESCRCSARHGVSVQRQQAERRDVAREVHLRDRRVSRGI